MRKFLYFILIIGVFSGCMSVKNVDIKSGQHADEFETMLTKKVGYKYWIYVPESYLSDEKDIPLVLFLHGAGERGSDLAKVKVHGPPKKVAQGEEFPFILVSPQCPEGVWWDTEILIALVDHLVSAYRIDQRRVYVTGLSMGGFATWDLIGKFPDRFAAAVPVCGGGEPRLMRGIGPIPVWAFHGAKDQVVPVDRSEIMVSALNQEGKGEAKLTIYPEADHDSWTVTYDNPEVYKWMLTQQKDK